MQRSAIYDLKKWKDAPERKPLIIRGARQVGKTWLMKEFGQSCYESYVYFNFDEEDELKSIFEANKNPQRIVELLSMVAGEKILPGETLVIFDEVQECPGGAQCAQILQREANEYHVIAAGSLLGTLLAQPKSCPVGMVNLLDLCPLTFDEFLEAADPALFAYYESIRKDQAIEEIFTTACWKPTTAILSSAGCRNVWPPGSATRTRRRFPKSSGELVEIYENDFGSTTGREQRPHPDGVPQHRLPARQIQ